MNEIEKLACAEITKLAFYDELEKIGYDPEAVAEMLKEAGFNPFAAFTNTGRMAKEVAKQRAKNVGQAVSWGPGLGRSGQATRKATAAMAGGPAGSGSVGAGTFGLR